MNEAVQATQVLSNQITAAGIAVYVLQLLKNSQKITWISASTGWLNRALSALLAALATVGIQVQFDQGAGMLTVTGLSLMTILGFAWKLVEQFVFQEMIYRGLAKK